MDLIASTPVIVRGSTAGWLASWRTVVVALMFLTGCASTFHPAKATGAASSEETQYRSRDRDRDADGIPDSQDAISDKDEERLADEAKPREPPTDPAMLALGGVDGKGAQSSPAAPDASVAKPRPTQLLAYEAQVTLAVYQVETALSAVEHIAVEADGYLSARTDTTISIRVPRAKFQESLKKITETGDVVHRNITVEDVTDQVFDFETRLRSAKALRDRLQELLSKASVKEAIEIEVELNRVTLEIERIEGSIKQLRDKVAYSTITVTFTPRGGDAVAKAPELPFPWLRELGLASLLRLEEPR